MPKPHNIADELYELYTLRNQYGTRYSREKLALLEKIQANTPTNARDVKRLHDTLCFIRAFPDSPSHHSIAAGMLGAFDEIVHSLPQSSRLALDETGIAGTRINYSFYYESAATLALRYPGQIEIDWDEMEDESRLEELLTQILDPAETDYFDSGDADCRDWISLAKGDSPLTDFEWLMYQIPPHSNHSKFWSALYNAVDLPLSWNLSGSSAARTNNFWPSKTIVSRPNGLNRRVRQTRKLITAPLRSIHRLPPGQGRKLIDIAIAALATVHRETDHFDFANPDEVYLADVGDGIHVAVTGLLPEHRFPLECTMGYLILANGVPVGYGGGSAMFYQVNTGINIFPEYRAAESAHLWVQVLRVFHQLLGCNRFIANPYQIGGDNDEALNSGAFWFYYRLGFRPADQETKKVARAEWKKLSTGNGVRTSKATLKLLSSSDLELLLPGATTDQLIKEPWLQEISRSTTQVLAKQHCDSHTQALRRCADKLSHTLCIPDRRSWSKAERHWFIHLSPLITALQPEAWTQKQKRLTANLVRSKGSPHELAFAKKLRKNDFLLRKLRGHFSSATS